MEFDVDHVFVLVAEGGPEARRLVEAGLTEGPSNVHPGQGTANRRFFFENAMLECLWVHAPDEARTGPARRTGLLERWAGRGEGACPFGIALRPAPGARPALPFAGWTYAPSYLPAGWSIHVAETSTGPTEPFLFYLPFADSPAHLAVGAPRHQAGVRRLTAVRLETPVDVTPDTRAATARTAGLAIERGGAYQLTLGFDGEGIGQTADLRPDLPLILRW